MGMITGVLVAVLLGWAAVAEAAVTVTARCDLGETIAGALTGLNAGGRSGLPVVVRVRGTCNENVVLEADGITLQGVGEAPTIAAPDAAEPAIAIEGVRRIVIQGLAITGGDVGVLGRRGASFDLKGSTVSGAARFGVAASFNTVATVQDCTVSGNGSHGVVASNGSSAVVTGGSVSGNTGAGILAFQNSLLRIGQDIEGSLTVRPVKVENNGADGIDVLDGSTAIVVGGRVRGNGGIGIVVARASNGRIGVGSSGLTATVDVRDNGNTGISFFQSSAGTVLDATVVDNGRDGISVTGSAATILGSRIRRNAHRGVVVVEGSGARIGVTDGLTGVDGNLITDNGSDGVGVFNGGFAWVAGNTIRGNTFSGLAVGRATVQVPGQNLIELNQTHGISLTNNAAMVQGPTDVALGSGLDTVRDNVLAGVNLFNGATAEIRQMSITGNDVNGITATLKSSVFIRNSTISDNTGDGVFIATDSAFFIQNIVDSPGHTTITGNSDDGVDCADSASSFGGDAAGIGDNGDEDVSEGCGGF
jgi:hypothetical protein